jgi:hypothetical protein
MQGSAKQNGAGYDTNGSAIGITAARTSELISGKLPDGFDPAFWVARRGLYPQLRCFSEYDNSEYKQASAISTVPFPAANDNESAEYIVNSFPLPRRVPSDNGYVYSNWRIRPSLIITADINTIDSNDSIFGWVNSSSPSDPSNPNNPWSELICSYGAPYERIIKYKNNTTFSQRNTIIFNQLVSEHFRDQELKKTTGCDASPREMLIQIHTNNINRVSLDGVLLSPISTNGQRLATVNVSRPGVTRKRIRVESYQNGELVVDEYIIAVERPFPAVQIFAPQRWNDVLAINNNFVTNGGYIIHEYEWYKNGRKLPDTKGYIQEPGGLDPGARYTAALTIDTPEGRNQVNTCPEVITAEPATKLAVYPNPVARGQTFRIVTQTGSQTVVRLFDNAGNTVSTGAFTGNVDEYAAPDVPGHYILQLTADGISQNVKIIIE